MAKRKQPEAKTRQPEEKTAEQTGQEELTAIEGAERFQSEPDFWEGEGWEVRAMPPAVCFGAIKGTPGLSSFVIL